MSLSKAMPFRKSSKKKRPYRHRSQQQQQQQTTNMSLLSAANKSESTSMYFDDATDSNFDCNPMSKAKSLTDFQYKQKAQMQSKPAFKNNHSVNISINTNSKPKPAMPLTPITLRPTYTSPLHYSISNVVSGVEPPSPSSLQSSLPNTPTLATSLPSTPIIDDIDVDDDTQFLDNDIDNGNETMNEMHKCFSANFAYATQEKQQLNVTENIRVIVRFRPINKTEKEYSERKHFVIGNEELHKFSHDIEYVNANENHIKLNYLNTKQKTQNYRSYTFKFDEIFREQTNQKQVFENVAKPICDQMLLCKQGMNATIFCYGQSGSGKTYTMFGGMAQQTSKKTFAKNHVRPLYQHRRSISEQRTVVGVQQQSLQPTTSTVTNEVESMGIIARSFCYIFDEMKDIFESKKAQKKLTYNIYIECIEIYNEKLRDLLNIKQVPIIREVISKKNNNISKTEIQNVCRKQVKSIKEILNILHFASMNRNIDRTALNDVSSRSHMIVRLVIKSMDTSKAESILNFVDLAGSETVRKSFSMKPSREQLATNQTPKVRKKRLKEAGNILKSLTALSQVIDALIKGKKHIPYKDSKLTRILANSLGGNCKTCLLICASPHIYNRYETLRSLKFGVRCQQIQNYLNWEVEDFPATKPTDIRIETEKLVKKKKRKKPKMRAVNSLKLTKKKSKNRNKRLRLKDSKSLGLKPKNMTREPIKKLTKSNLKLRDCKSLTLKNTNSNQTMREYADSDELLRHIEQLNIENELLRSKADITENLSRLNETISSIVLQGALKKKQKRKKKGAVVAGEVENELNLFQNSLVQITMQLNGKLQKIDDLIENGLSTNNDNDDDDDDDEDDDEEEVDVHIGDGDKDNNSTPMAEEGEEIEDEEILTFDINSHLEDEQDEQQQHAQEAEEEEEEPPPLLKKSAVHKKIYSHTIVNELRQKNEALISQINHLKKQQNNNHNNDASHNEYHHKFHRNSKPKITHSVSCNSNQQNIAQTPHPLRKSAKQNRMTFDRDSNAKNSVTTDTHTTDDNQNCKKKVPRTFSEQFHMTHKLSKLRKISHSNTIFVDSITKNQTTNQTTNQTQGHNHNNHNALTATSLQSNTTTYTTPTPSSQSARSSINSNSLYSTTVDSIDEHLEKWNYCSKPFQATRHSNNFNTPPPETPPLSSYATTNSAVSSPINYITAPNSRHSPSISSFQSNYYNNSPQTTPHQLQQSSTPLMSYNDIPFADNNNEKELSMSQLFDGPPIKEEEDDNDNESDLDQYEYSTDDEAYYSNNVSSNDLLSGATGAKYRRARNDSMIFKAEGMKLSKKLKAQSVESPCHTNQRLSNTFALHWINVRNNK